MIRRGVALWIAVMLLAGCWDRREVNDVAFVVGSGVDREGDQFRTTLQIAVPGRMPQMGGKRGGTAGEKPWLIHSVVAPSVRAASDRQQKSLSRQLYYAHRRVFLIGEEAARAGIEPIVDVLARVPQNRLTSFVVVTQGPAREILTADAPLEQFPSEIVRELSISAMRTPQTLKTVVEAMISTGRDPFLPLIGLRGTDPGPGGQQQTLLEVKGLAVFRENRLATMLEDEEAMGLLWAMGQARSPTVQFPAPKGGGRISVQFQEQSAGLTPVVQGDRIMVHVVVRARGTVVENSSRYPLGPDRNMENFQTLVDRHVAEMVRKAIQAVQEHGSDPIGIGDLVHRRNPQVWHRIEKRWRELYPEVKFVIEPQILLANPGALVEPFGVPPEKEIE